MTIYLVFLFLVSSAKISSITLKGVNSLPRKEVTSVLHLKKGEILRKPLLTLGILKLEDLYHSKGFFDFKVIKDSIYYDKEGAHVFLKVNEGKRRIVGKLLFNGIKLIDSMTLQKLVKVQPPFCYDEGILEGVETRLISFYSDTGYPFVELSHNIVSDTLDTLKILYTVKEGPRVVVDNIQILGLKRVRKKIVKREIRIKPGEIYRFSKIIESKRRIYATGLFASVKHYLAEENERGDTVILVFSLEERNPRYVGFGLGVSTPKEAQAKISLGHNNLFNNAQHLDIISELYSDFSRLKRKKIDVNYSEPYLLGFNLTGKTHSFYYQDMDRNLKEWGLDLQIQKMITSHLRLTALLGWKKSYQVKTTEGPTVNLFRLEPLYDTRDNLFNPEKGIFALVKIDRAGGILGGDNDFYRIAFDISQYQRITHGGYILALHLGAGDIWPYEKSKTVLLSEQFTLGGPGSVRGYRRNEIGPNVYNEVHSGTKLLLGNLELRKKVSKHLGFVIFLDVGGLWNSWKNATINENTALSSGLGVRVYTPIGPISLDWGIKLKDRLPSDRGKVILFFGQMF